MIFASDNTGPVHPRIMAAVMAANDGYAMPYGNDPTTQAARDAVRDLFEAPEAAVEFVATGSVANALALACLARPWDGVFCHRIAHVEEDECGAPDFYSGAKTILIDGADAKFTPEALEAAIVQCKARGVHGAQPGPVTITNITERGTVYTLEEIRAIWRDRVAGFDAVALPTSPILPPERERLMTDADYYVSENLLALRNTRIGNLMDGCALSLPTSEPSCGLMLLAGCGQEDRLLRLGMAAEAALR